MSEVMNQILYQTALYAIPMVLTFFAVSFLYRGLFWKFIKVRASFGRLVLIKLRTHLRDEFRIGWIEDDFLVYTEKSSDGTKNKIRLSFKPKDSPIYRCLGVQWVDVDGEKFAISKTNYEPMEGYDMKKYDNLYIRALQKPSSKSLMELITIICLIILILMVGASIYFAYQNYTISQALAQMIPQITAKIKGSVVTAATGI